MKRLVSTLNLSKEDWLRYRKCGITGTDAGAILGMNPYRSAFQVYHDKISDTIENIDNEAMRQGRDLEDYVAQRFSEETGFKVLLILKPFFPLLCIPENAARPSSGAGGSRNRR